MDIITLALCKRMGKSKADIDGVYPNLIAGGVVESEVRDEDFSNKVTEHTGTAYINSIKGNTLVWNQLVNLIISSTTTGGITYTVSNGEFTINGTATETLITKLMNDCQFQSGHSYLFKGIPSSASGSTHRLDLRQTSDGGVVRSDIKENTIITIGASVSAYITLRVQSGAVISNAKYSPQIFDLTQMGLETADQFNALFSKSYYAYNQGSLLSFNGNGIKTVGFNQWDEEWEVGNWRSSDGQSGSLTDRIRSKNYIEVFPNTDYYFKSPVGIFTSICWYDESHAFISSTGGTSSSVNTVFKSPVNVKYMRFNMNEVYGTVYNNDICINISNTELNGTYEPYTSSTLSLPISTYFPTGMKSAGTVYDELKPSKATKRLELFKITSANIQSSYLDTQNNQWLGYVSIPDIKQISDGSIVANIVCNTLVTKNQGSLFGEIGSAIALLANSTNVRITIRGVTTFADMQTWLDNNPTYFIYELATTTETDVNLDLSYKTYEGGTEQLLPENGSVPVTSPIKTNVEFAFDENINALLDKMLNMIAPVETSPTSNAYSIGQYLIYDYVLYKVTSAIASGGTITVGTNVEATTIASVLESL